MFRKQQTSFFITMTRFNQETWEQNLRYRYNNGITGSIYGIPRQPTSSIPYGATMFVLEMKNINDKKNLEYPGRIMGISIVKNRPCVFKHNIYEDRNYNRFVYCGKFRLDRREMNIEQENMIQKLEQICFYGKTHLKRGQGITLLPQLQLQRLVTLPDICIRILENKLECSRSDIQND